MLQQRLNIYYKTIQFFWFFQPKQLPCTYLQLLIRLKLKMVRFILTSYVTFSIHTCTFSCYINIWC